MSGFEVGDKVECVNPCLGLTRGKVYIVKEAIVRDSVSLVEVVNDRGTNCQFLGQRFRLVERSDKHQADLDEISKALWAEAEERGWCDEFEDFIEDLNKRLTVPLVKPKPAEPEWPFEVGDVLKGGNFHWLVEGDWQVRRLDGPGMPLVRWHKYHLLPNRDKWLSLPVVLKGARTA